MVSAQTCAYTLTVATEWIYVPSVCTGWSNMFAQYALSAPFFWLLILLCIVNVLVDTHPDILPQLSNLARTV